MSNAMFTMVIGSLVTITARKINLNGMMGVKILKIKHQNTDYIYNRTDLIIQPKKISYEKTGSFGMVELERNDSILMPIFIEKVKAIKELVIKHESNDQALNDWIDKDIYPMVDGVLTMPYKETETETE